VSVQTTSRDPTPADLWRAARLPVLIVGAVLAVTVLLAIVANRTQAGLLDPRAVDPSGSRALATLLRDQGVRVDLVQTVAEVGRAEPGDTVLVTHPGVLQEQQLTALRETGADLVLVAPGQPALDVLAGGLAESGADDVAARSPACSLHAAARAGVADMGDVLYAAAAGADAALCYPAEDGAGLAQTNAGGRQVTAIGTPVPLTNDRLDEQGNAALSMMLLGANERLLWYLPALDDPALEPRSVGDLVPGGVRWGLLQLAIAIGLLAVWQARRLGPVVVEPLPVVVRAAETVEGRARLYRRSAARDRAAAALREAALARIVPMVGLSRQAQPTEVVAAVAARSPRPAPEVGVLLYGSVPHDDMSLIRLADELDRLEREVRRR
jgi:hypothetical protein